MSNVIKLTDYRQTVTSGDGETIKITRKAQERVDAERLKRIKASISKINRLMEELGGMNNAKD
jgi:ribosomal protein L18E